MESFDHLFDSHFTDPQRTLSNSLGGFVDHAVRLNANLPGNGPLKALLLAANAETQAKSLRAQQVQQTLGLSLSGQKLATSQTLTAQTKALDRIRKNEGTLKGDSLVEDEEVRESIYAQLYPTGGLKYYTNAKLGTQLSDRLGEYLASTEANAGVLGDVFVSRVRTDLGLFRQVRETQVAKISTTGDVQDNRHELVGALNEQCDYNFHLLSGHFRLELHRAANFWNPSFYLRAAPHATPGQVLNKAVQAHQHRQLFDLASFAPMTSLALTLRDGGPLCLALADKATAPLPANTLAVPAGNAPFSTLLADVPGIGTHLIAYNETGKVAHLNAQLS